MDRFIIMSVLSLLAPQLALLMPLAIWSNWWARRWSLIHRKPPSCGQKIAILIMQQPSRMCMRLTYAFVVMVLCAVGFDFQFGFAPRVVLLANLIVATALFWCHNWRRKCNEAESRQFEQTTETLTFVQSQLHDGTCPTEVMSIFQSDEPAPRMRIFDFSQPTTESSGQGPLNDRNCTSELMTIFHSDEPRRQESETSIPQDKRLNALVTDHLSSTSFERRDQIVTLQARANIADARNAKSIIQRSER